MKLYTFDPKKQKEVLSGYLEGTIFVKKVKKSHFHIKYQAYAIQTEIIKKLLELQIDTVKLEGKKKTYLVSLDTWIEKSILNDFGHGEQFFLPIKYMKEIDNG